MKNFKKVVAAAAAVAMTMSIGVSAFAEATASYADGKVKVSGVTMDNGKQYTVIVIAADKANKTLDAADLYYINQGDNKEAFWTNGLGVKEDLAAGEYIVRMGGEDLAQVIEIPLTVGAAGDLVLHLYGDINFDKAIDMVDALEVIYFYGEFDEFSYWDEYDNYDKDFYVWTAADVNRDGAINMSDALQIIYFYGEFDEFDYWDEYDAGEFVFYAKN